MIKLITGSLIGDDRSCAEKYSVDDGLTDEEVDVLEEERARKFGIYSD